MIEVPVSVLIRFTAVWGTTEWRNGRMEAWKHHDMNGEWVNDRMGDEEWMNENG